MPLCLSQGQRLRRGLTRQTSLDTDQIVSLLHQIEELMANRKISSRDTLRRAAAVVGQMQRGSFSEARMEIAGYLNPTSEDRNAALTSEPRMPSTSVHRMCVVG
jgi:hypothetical protein